MVIIPGVMFAFKKLKITYFALHAEPSIIVMTLKKRYEPYIFLLGNILDINVVDL
jgi:hypothetical protein